MDKLILIALVLFSLNRSLCRAQVLKFGKCPEVETKKYFELEKFLGEWYEIERFPTWYEDFGSCAYKRVQACGRHIEIEHVYVKDGIEFVLHVNSTYMPGDDAIFYIQENNIDPVGMPLSVISTDYTNYTVIYGCRNNLDIGLQYISAWILSRSRTLEPELLRTAHQELTSIPYASTAYLEKVEQREEKCAHHWTAHVHAINVHETVEEDDDEDRK